MSEDGALLNSYKIFSNTSMISCSLGNSKGGLCKISFFVKLISPGFSLRISLRPNGKKRVGKDS